MEGEGGVTESIIDGNDPWDIQGDLMEGESGFPGTIIDELHYSDIQEDQNES